MKSLFISIAIIIGLVIFGSSFYIYYVGQQKSKEYPFTGTLFRENSFSGGVVIDDNNNLNSVEECRAWAAEAAEKLNLSDSEWDYECGIKCVYAEKYSIGSQRSSYYNCQEVTK